MRIEPFKASHAKLIDEDFRTGIENAEQIESESEAYVAMDEGGKPFSAGS